MRRLLTAVLVLCAVAAPPAEAASSVCGPAARTIAANDVARVLVRHDQLRSCVRGRPSVVLGPWVGDQPVRLRGRIVAWAREVGDDLVVQVLRARDGSAVTGAVGQLDRRGATVALGRGGAVAWTQRPEFVRDSLEIVRPPGCGATVVASVSAAAAESMRIEGERIVWNGGEASVCRAGRMGRGVCGRPTWPEVAGNDVIAVLGRLDLRPKLSRLHLCVRGRASTRKLAGYGVLENPSDVVVEGRWVAWREDDCDRYLECSLTRVFAESASGDRSVEALLPPARGRFVLAPRGRLVTIAGAGFTSDPNGWVEVVQETGSVTLDRGTGIDPTSLRVAGGVVHWTRDGVERSAPLP